MSDGAAAEAAMEEEASRVAEEAEGRTAAAEEAEAEAEAEVAVEEIVVGAKKTKTKTKTKKMRKKKSVVLSSSSSSRSSSSSSASATAAASFAPDVLNTAGQVPFRPPLDPELLKSLVANFTPEPERSRIDLEDPDHADDAREIFDNRWSCVPWVEDCRFNTPVQMREMVNGHTLDDPWFMRMLGFPLSLLTACGYTAFKRKGVPEGYFREVRKGLITEIRLPGYYTLYSPASHWGPLHPLDDETQNLVHIGPKLLLRVRANHIGTAYLVGDKKLVDADQTSIARGKDGDAVLFSQGSYVLDDAKYLHVHVEPIKEHKSIIGVGSVTVLNIGPTQVGGALHRATNEYHIFQRGAPIIFDNKEWCDFEVKERTKRGRFTVGTFEFCTVSGGIVLCAGRKDGSHVFIDEEDTYRFDRREWETFDFAMNTDSYDCGGVMVRTVDRHQVGVVRDRRDGEYYDLEPGKYVLLRRDYEPPIIADFSKPKVRVGPWTYLRIEEDYRAGAWNARTGQFDEFSDKAAGEVMRLHCKLYPRVERVKKVRIGLSQPFGPFKIITIPSGQWGIFEEDGKLRKEEPGTYTLRHGCQILDSLPRCPQELQSSVDFLTMDGFYMQTYVVTIYEVHDVLALTENLRSKGESFSDLRSRLAIRAMEAIVRLLRTFRRDELLKSEDAGNPVIVDKGLEELNNFSEDAKLGLSFTGLSLSSGFVLLDKEVIANVYRLSSSTVKTMAAKAQIHAEEASARAQAVVPIERAVREKNINLLLQQTKLEMDEKSLLTEKRVMQQALDLRIEGQKIEKSKHEMTLEMNLAKTRATADAEAYSIIAVAEANFELAAKENTVGQQRPKTLTAINESEIWIDCVRSSGKIAWKYPDLLFEVLNTMNKKSITGQMINTSDIRLLKKKYGFD